MDMSPKPLKDRFGGRYSEDTGPKRSWDEGQPKGFRGCDVAEAKGSTAGGACKLSQSRVSNPGRTTAGDGGAIDIGFPMTGTRGDAKGEMGMGPKAQKKAGGGGKMRQMGHTGSTDRSPKPLKDRFKGRLHGM